MGSFETQVYSSFDSHSHKMVAPCSSFKFQSGGRRKEERKRAHVSAESVPLKKLPGNPILDSYSMSSGARISHMAVVTRAEEQKYFVGHLLPLI